MRKLLAFGWLLVGGVAFGDIETAITNGASFLLSKQAADGHWSDPQMPALTALPLWALSAANIPNLQTSQTSLTAA